MICVLFIYFLIVQYVELFLYCFTINILCEGYKKQLNIIKELLFMYKITFCGRDLIKRNENNLQSNNII